MKPSELFSNNINRILVISGPTLLGAPSFPDIEVATEKMCIGEMEGGKLFKQLKLDKQMLLEVWVTVLVGITDIKDLWGKGISRIHTKGYLCIRMAKWPLAPILTKTIGFGRPWVEMNFELSFGPPPPFSLEI
ncbi:hypothetical protein ACFE04_016274 [Oxalis oulophora]